MELSKEYIQNLRQDYSHASLSESDIDQNPLKQFEKWFKEAVDSQLSEPNVMTLATASLSGKPSARILLLKGFDENGFTFFTNYSSKKGRELEENPYAAIVFFWAELQRQVRIEGVISKVDEDASSAYFHSRPKGSQIGAAASPQSSIIPDREVLEKQVTLLTEKYNGQEVPRPLNWGGYQLKPTHIEFWQGRSSRLHDRIAYTSVDGTWLISRLAP
jgi:pyridoxamine 5'-phosphate oxidase